MYRTMNLGRAEHLTEIMRSEGLDAVMTNRHGATLEPLSLMYGICVMVPEKQRGEAREIMNAFAF
ncbi:MAG: DUF2007 domain-containing protein [Deltaproteobacteria bacterium]|nr:DUF2007 domain-containing protein [Deltaproteobacteria bacterium]